MLQQRDNSDGSISSPRLPPSSLTARSSLYALLYKSTRLQARAYCSNICQILTPLLCVLFTLLVQIITSQIITSKVEIPTWPRPYDMGILYQLLPMNISCREIYLYQLGEGARKQVVDRVLMGGLKRYCAQTGGLQPSYIEKQAMNVYMMELLKQAEKETYIHGVDMQAPIPDGTYKFHNLSNKQLDVTVSVNDYRLAEYHRNNGITKLSLSTGASIMSYVMTSQGMMTIIQKITRPFLQLTQPKQVIFGSYMYMPFDGEDTALIDKTVNVIGSGLYPLGLSLLMPLFLYAIVSEKEERLIEIMRMNGLKLKYYWLCTFVFNFGLSMVTFTVFYVMGAWVLKLSFFTTSWVLMWAIFVGWAIAQISMTNFVQIFIRNAKSATIIGYILSIFSTLVGQTIAVAVYADPLTMPIWLLMYPPFALCRIIYLLGIACSSTGCYSSITHINHQSTLILIILYSWLGIFVLSIWLNDQIQQQYGVARDSKLMKVLRWVCGGWWRGRDKGELLEGKTSEIEIEMQEGDDRVGVRVDKTVGVVREEVRAMAVADRCLVIKDLSKRYQTSNGKEDYIALKPLTLAIEQREIFGLLGPNGAGKTTLISVLTAMYPKTSGNAWINGIEVSTGRANEYIGVCPQFDLLWSTLSVYQHLKFYAILKGVNPALLQQKIIESLYDVDLQDWKHTPSGNLSGGMQRRLSIAIALVGSPSVVFLDEPSSGLDPSHRRKMWDILNKCKKKTSIILTTHLMEQAEALCDRIGIISKGELKCIGKTQQLKQLYGEGYRLHINFIDLLSEGNDGIVRDVQEKFNAKIVNQLDSRVILKVEKKLILDCVKWIKNVFNVNWMVSQPSLYDVFMNFVQ